MAKAGDMIEHPLTGERIIFYKTAADTDGALLQFEYRGRPRAHGIFAPEHVHPHQQERFQVLAGTLSARINDFNLIAIPGHSFVIPAGKAHAWWNGGDDELRVLVEVRPALQTERLLEALFARVEARQGQPSLGDRAVLAYAFREEQHTTGPGWALEQAIGGLISPLAHWLDRQPEAAHLPRPSGERIAAEVSLTRSSSG
jgi:mannose-6-phosphate isomerase-like protein (cupin superfamily)